MRTSESIQKISAALAKALPQVQNATKDATNPHFRSDYASLQAVLATTKPVLAEHGLVVIQGPGWDGEHCTLTTRILHESGEWIETVAGTPVSKMDPQGIGSAITYLRRYSLAGMAGIGQEDDDGNAASERRDANGQKAGAERRGPSKAQGGDTCPSCESSGYWDNRAKKKSGDFSAKSPDYACKDKDGCGWALWTADAKQKIAKAIEGLATTNTISPESAKHVLEGIEDGDLAALRAAQDWIRQKQDEAREVQPA